MDYAENMENAHYATIDDKRGNNGSNYYFIKG
jgi:hypothetical protein